MPSNNSPIPKTNKIFWQALGIGVIIVLAIIVTQTVKLPKKAPEPGTGQKTDTPQLQVKKTEVPVTESPERFPADIPIETGAKIVQNYNAETEDGRFQATRVFETSKTLAANYALYKDFFTKNGWMILTTLDQPSLKVVSAKKDNIVVQVNISENSVTKVKTVDISVAYLP
ncbi:MAG: hypothetical protein HY609_06820 [Deltaproteobacteria bacterium]|nr:hypothetical protein [Candidatus Doudnabacteria bacterium]MBI4224632.1 hypothetical protein [Deltaproteobacteria bacterium]